MADPYIQAHSNQAGIATIEFFHPQSNALTIKMLHQLAHEIHHAGSTGTQVIVLRSGGEKSFCAGASFDELAAVSNPAEGEAFFSGFAHVLNAMRTCGKLIIARVHGKCTGGGVGLAAAADYAIANTTAEIRLSELSIGLGPFVVGPAIERKIGTGPFGHLAIDAAMWRSADWAKRKGLYAEVHDNNANMDESIDRLAGTIAHSSPDALIALKKMLWAGTENWGSLLEERAAISGRLAAGGATRTAIARFKSKH
jgi:methylglutaconyl-CoA hydratase